MIITEKADVQEKITEYLRNLDWEIIYPEDALRKYRNNDITEPFLLPILRQKLMELNKGILDEKSLDELLRRLRNLQPSLKGNKEFLQYLRGLKTVYVKSEKRERNVKLIDFENPENNHYAFVMEFSFKDREKKRLDIVLLINGIPIAVVETKRPEEDNGIVDAQDQIRNYNEALKELFKYLQFYVATDGLKLYYGPTWKYETKVFYVWKPQKRATWDEMVTTFFDKNEILDTIREYISFITQDGELYKYLTKYHQRRAIRKIIQRVLEGKKKKGLIWHTQGAFKTMTMILTADELRKLPQLENPTILLVVDRIELEAQAVQNFIAYGYPNVVRAESKKHLQELLESDYRGLIITTIHKFDKMPKDINTRSNIVVLIDEAHRSQEGDLGTYMRAALPNAYFFGFTGTPIDKTSVGKGTFIAFGYPPDEPYLDKYTIDESIEEGTTVPLYYQLTETNLHVPSEILDKEFYEVVEKEGVVSLEGINKIIKKAKKLKAVLKSKDRIDKIAKHIAEHYKKYVEPLGFKAFIVAVDREGCALYKEAIDKYLPPEYTKVVYTKNHNDPPLLSKYHMSEEEEARIRKIFKDPEKLPKILIVTEKLLTGYDAPVLYAMYLDKPLKDHTLLQAIARVNRPYKGKKVGLIVDYIGIFDNLQKALAFYSQDISTGLVNIEQLKERFGQLIEEARNILNEIRISNLSETRTIQTAIVEYFWDDKRRKTFKKLFKEIQDIYEVLSPDPFLRDYIEDYKLLVQIYTIIESEFGMADKRRIRRHLLRKTEKLIGEHVELISIIDDLPIYKIDANIAERIKKDNLPERVKVANLARSIIVKIKNNAKENPYLLSIGKKVEEVIERLKSRQISSETALEELISYSQLMAKSEEERKESTLDNETFSYHWILREEAGIKNSEIVAQEVKETFDEHKYWMFNDEDKRMLKIKLYKIFQMHAPNIFKNKIKSKQLVEQLLYLNKQIFIGENDE